MEKRSDITVRSNRSSFRPASFRPAFGLVATLSTAVVATWLVPTLVGAATAPTVDSGSGAPSARTVGRITGLLPGTSNNNVLSFRWAATMPVSSSGVPSGKPTFADVSFTRAIDNQSPQLLVSLAQGTHFSAVSIQIFQPGTTTVQVRYDLSDVLIVGSNNADPGRNNGGQPLEEISLTFSKIQVTSGVVVFCYDRASGTRC